MSEVLYPHVYVNLVGEDGNAFAIMGHVSRAMRRAKVPTSAIKEFTDEATSGDYDNLLRTCMKYVSVDRDEDDEDKDDYDEYEDDDEE